MPGGKAPRTLPDLDPETTVFRSWRSRAAATPLPFADVNRPGAGERRSTGTGAQARSGFRERNSRSGASPRSSADRTRFCPSTGRGTRMSGALKASREIEAFLRTGNSRRSDGLGGPELYLKGRAHVPIAGQRNRRLVPSMPGLSATGAADHTARPGVRHSFAAAAQRQLTIRSVSFQLAGSPLPAHFLPALCARARNREHMGRRPP